MYMYRACGCGLAVGYRGVRRRRVSSAKQAQRTASQDPSDTTKSIPSRIKPTIAFTKIAMKIMNSKQQQTEQYKHVTRIVTHNDKEQLIQT